MKFLPTHWVALIVAVLIGYYAGTKGWLSAVTSKLPAVGG